MPIYKTESLDPNLSISHLFCTPNADSVCRFIPDLLKRQLIQLTNLSYSHPVRDWLLVMDPTIVPVCSNILTLFCRQFLGFDVLTLRDPFGHSIFRFDKKL